MTESAHGKSGVCLRLAVLCMSFGFMIVAVSASNEEHDDGIGRDEMRKLCGANCLYIISRHYGMEISYEGMCSLLSPSDLGVSMLQLKEAAEQLGYRTKALEIDPKDILLFSKPLIGRAIDTRSKNRTYGHFLVIVPDSSKGGCWVFDPSSPDKNAKFSPTLEPEGKAAERVQILLLEPTPAKTTPKDTLSLERTPEKAGIANNATGETNNLSSGDR